MSPRRGARRRLGSIRTSLVLLALVPSVTLAAIWGVTTTTVLSEGIKTRSQTGLSKSTGALGTDLTLALQTERRLSAEALSSTGSSGAALKEQRERTDAAVKKLGSHLDDLKDAPARVKDRIYPVISIAEGLQYYRGQVDNPTDINAQQVFEHYSEIVHSQIGAFQELSKLDNGDLASEAEPLVALDRMVELTSQEDAVLTLVWPEKRLDANQYPEFAEIVSAKRWLIKEEIRPFLTGETKTMVEEIMASKAWQDMTSVEDDIMADHAAGGSFAGAKLPNSEGKWRSAMDDLSTQQSELIRDRTTALLDHGSTRARSLLLEATLVSIGGLVALIVSVVLSWRVTRSLSRRLRGLRKATLHLAESRLPDVVERLHRGERIDVNDEAPELDYGGDELGQVAQAFNAAQRTAVSSAVELADTRQGFQKVILGVARHTQNLVNRQLSLLDTLEREHQDPSVLKGLYELDSTASQMRRYEENLVIISGGQPGRRWSEPVAVVDVLRGAVGEVADYQRVRVHAEGNVRLAAPAVADVIHLLAELIENATVFSPAPKPVQVRADIVVNGLAVEIEDRGLGMPANDYAALNRQLAEPPSFDVMALADDSRMGMFVISRLADRHGIKVTLRSSPYGGTTAIVLIPEDIVIRDVTEDLDGSAADVDSVPLPKRRGASDRLTRLDTVPAQARGHAADFAPGPAPAPAREPAQAPAQDQGVSVKGGFNGQLAAVSAPAPAPAGGGGPAPLPRRVPQTNLVTELRHEPPTVPATAEPAVTPRETPSAEDAASSLSAFQRGTQHARHENPSRVPKKDA